MYGKIIIIEGLDGSGKSTQFELLQSRFGNCRFITFPNYDSPSGQIITEYLNGNFKEENPLKSAYSASTLYAVDRYTSYKSDWGKDYESGKNIISARYTTSNAIYQMTKLEKSLWNDYCSWLYDLEYNKMGIPRPDAVIFLDVPVEISQKLLSVRYNGDESRKDIHESDINYLRKCRESALYASSHENKNTPWHIINCCENNMLRSIQDIQTEIVKIISDILTRFLNE